MPARDFFAGGFCCIEVPRDAIGTIIAALDGLKYRDSWYGEKDLINTSCLQMETTIANIMVCKVCGQENGGNGATETCECGGPVYALLEDAIMGIFITDITCEDGILYKHYGPCCKKEIGCDAGSIIQPPPPDTEIDPDDPTTWACNKSQGMAVTWFGVINEVVTALESVPSLYDMYQPCKNVLSRFGAQWDNIRQVCQAYFNHRAAVEAMAADTDTPDFFACSWANTLLPTDNLSTDEFWTIQTSFSARWAGGAETFLVAMTFAVQYANFAWWAQLFHDSLATCDCPEGPIQAGSIWFTGEYVGPNGGDFVIEESEVQYSGRRIRIRAACNGGGNKEFFDLEYAFAGQQSGDYLTVRVYPLTRVPADVPDLDIDPITESQWGDHRIDGTPLPILRSDESGYVEFSMQENVANLPQLVDMKGWKYPISSTGTERYEWYVEIVAINGVDLGAIGP